MADYPSDAEIESLNASEEGGSASSAPRNAKKKTPFSPDELPPPLPQVVQDAVLLGFDPETSVATFAFDSNGRRQEMTCLVPRNDPLYQQNYRLLLSAVERDGRVPALRIRAVVPRDPSQLPTLIFATPTVDERENKFSWNGTKLTWTEDLDQAVDIDFDRAADEFAAKYLRDQLQASDPEYAFTGPKMIARDVFTEEATLAGLGIDVTSLMDDYGKDSLSAVLSGNEYVGGVTRQVRYDTRYSFQQQARHVLSSGDPKSIASALANYSAQKALTVDAAERARGGCDLGNGTMGSLAEMHQQELLSERMLLGPNPSLAEFKTVFAQYSSETVRSAVAGNLGGMMDVAGVSAARAEIDIVEHDKNNSNSKYNRVLESLPVEDRNHPDPAFRAGAFLNASLTLEGSFRAISKAEVGNSQAMAAPSQRDMLPPVQRENALANAARGGLSALERVIDLM